MRSGLPSPSKSWTATTFQLVSDTGLGFSSASPVRFGPFMVQRASAPAAWFCQTRSARPSRSKSPAGYGTKVSTSDALLLPGTGSHAGPDTLAVLVTTLADSKGAGVTGAAKHPGS